MPKRVPISESDLLWLRDNHRKTSYTKIAERLGVCVDTAKRILVRQGLQQFDGAKYQTSQSSIIKTWTRPCLDCGDTTERPKSWYYCRPCRLSRGYDNEE